MTHYELQVYQTAAGKQPFNAWLEGIEHAKAYLQDYQDRTKKANAGKRSV